MLKGHSIAHQNKAALAHGNSCKHLAATTSKLINIVWSKLLLQFVEKQAF